MPPENSLWKLPPETALSGTLLHPLKFFVKFLVSNFICIEIFISEIYFHSIHSFNNKQQFIYPVFLSYLFSYTYIFDIGLWDLSAMTHRYVNNNARNLTRLLKRIGKKLPSCYGAAIIRPQHTNITFYSYFEEN